MLNEFKHIMADIGGVWIGHWAGYLYTSTIMALGYTQTIKRNKEGIGEGERTERQSKRETRELLEQFNIPEEYGDKYVETTEHPLSEKERRLIEQDREIARLHNQLLSYIIARFESGEVDRLPNMDELVIYFSDTVKAKVLSTDQYRTIYLCLFDENSSMPEHNHSQEQLIQIVEGEMKVLLIRDNTVISEKILKKGDSFVINPYINHITKSEKGCKALFTFEPPLIKYESEED